MVNYYYNSSGGPGRRFPFGNPVANALVVLVGALAIGASVVLGFLAFVALGSILLVLAAIIGIRVWWLNRKLAFCARRGDVPPDDGRVRIHVIEGEYRDVSRDRRKP